MSYIPITRHTKAQVAGFSMTYDEKDFDENLRIYRSFGLNAFDCGERGTEGGPSGAQRRVGRLATRCSSSTIHKLSGWKQRRRDRVASLRHVHERFLNCILLRSDPPSQRFIPEDNQRPFKHLSVARRQVCPRPIVSRGSWPPF